MTPGTSSNQGMDTALPRLEDHNGFGVGSRHSRDQIVRSQRKREVGSIVSFRFPVRVETSNDNGDVGCFGDFDRLLDELIFGYSGLWTRLEGRRRGRDQERSERSLVGGNHGALERGIATIQSQ